MRQLIEQFSAGDLFGRDNYEYYARVTGRILRVKDEWICSFRDPPPPRHRRDQEAYARKFLTFNTNTCRSYGLSVQLSFYFRAKRFNYIRHFFLNVLRNK